jgi:hypothetical protein
MPHRHFAGFAAAVAALMGVAAPAMGQRPAAATSGAPASQVVSISPISLVFGILGAEYEKRVGPASSLGASGTYYRNREFTYTSGEAKYRYYPQERALEGFGVGLTGGLTRIASRGSTSDESGTAVSIGFALDYQWLLGPKEHFAVTLGTGARRLIAIGTKVNGAALTLPTIRISIGRAF